MYPTWVTANTGNLPVKVSSSLLQFNPGGQVFGYYGRQLQLSNQESTYRWKFGGGVATSWYKIADITIGLGLYSGASFEVDVLNVSGNFGNTVMAEPYRYYVSCTRSGAVQDDMDYADVSGPNATFVRVVKTATGVFELQVAQPYDWIHVEVACHCASRNIAVVTYANSPGAGSAPGTAYTATAQHWHRLTNLEVTGAYAMFGTSSGYSYFHEDTLNFHQATNANATGWINHVGYAGGTTQFRDLTIGDGKNNAIAFFDGSTGHFGSGTVSPKQRVSVLAPAAAPSLTHDTAAHLSIRYADTYSTDMVFGVTNVSPYPGWIQMRHVDVDGVVYPLVLNPLGGNVGVGLLGPLARLHTYEATALGAVLGNSQIVERTEANVGNLLQHNQYAYRDAAGSDWTTARWHDSIGVDVSFQTPGTDTRVWWERDPQHDIQSWGNAAATYLTINAGNVGIGTSTVPHGGIGCAKFAIEGTLNSLSAGPHVQYTVSSDDYPVFQQLNYSHNNVLMYFDSYINAAGVDTSSYAGSNYGIFKSSDLFSIRYDSGIAAGAAITWNDGIVLNTSGNVGIGGAATYRLDVFGGDINLAEGQYYRYGAGILAYAQTALHNYYFGSAGNLTTTGTYNTAVGDSAGVSLTTGAYNMFVGGNAGRFTTEGADNLCIGMNCGMNNQTGLSNVFLGSNAGNGPAGVYTGANYNIGIGYTALYQVTTNSVGNTAVGKSAGYNSSTGTCNVFVGMEAGYGSGGVYTGADYNVCVGYRSGYSLVADADSNTLIGTNSGRAYGADELTAVGMWSLGNCTGVGNTALGTYAGLYSTTGVGNVFVGYSSGFGHAGAVYTGANYNTCVGYKTGYDLDDAALNNTLIGAYAGENLTTGDSNVLIGNSAGDTLTTQSGAVAVGSSALYITTGANNTALGFQAGYWSATGVGNTFLGYEAGFGNGGAGGYTGADYNTAVGYHAGFDLDTAALNNTLIGASAGENVTTGDGNTFLGYTSGFNSTTNTYNSFIGYEAGYGSGGVYTDTHYNVALGYRAAYSINGASGSCSYNVMVGANAGAIYGGDYLTAVGSAAAQLTTGASNTALGYMAGYACRTGAGNTFLGREAGRGLAGAYDGSDYNVIIGYRAGYDIQGGADSNTFVGALAGENITTGDGNVCLGYKAGSALTTEDNYLYIANSDAGAGATLLTGNFATGSLGIGMAPASITARLHLPAGTATASTAPLKFTDGVLLGTAEEGAFELDVANFWMTPISTQRQAIVGCVYSQYDDVTVTATASETTLLHGASYRGSKTLVANFFGQAGKAIRVRAWGVYTSSQYTLTVKIKLTDTDAAELVLSTGAMGFLSSTDRGWSCEADIVCYSTGAAGTFWGQGRGLWHTSATAATVADMENTAVTTLKTTGIIAVDVTAQWSGSGADTITCTNVTIEALD